jgi:hypothetical protein
MRLASDYFNVTRIPTFLPSTGCGMIMMLCEKNVRRLRRTAAMPSQGLLAGSEPNIYTLRSCGIHVAQTSSFTCRSSKWFSHCHMVGCGTVCATWKPHGCGNASAAARGPARTLDSLFGIHFTVYLLFAAAASRVFKDSLGYVLITQNTLPCLQFLPKHPPPQTNLLRTYSSTTPGWIVLRSQDSLSFPVAEDLHHQWLSCFRRAYTKGFISPSYRCEG